MPLSERLLLKLPWWVRVPVKCERCWRFQFEEPWEIKYLEVLCKRHLAQVLMEERVRYAYAPVWDDD